MFSFQLCNTHDPAHDQPPEKPSQQKGRSMLITVQSSQVEVITVNYAVHLYYQKHITFPVPPPPRGRSSNISTTQRANHEDDTECHHCEHPHHA